jgi:acetyl esterase/lipase
MLDPASKRYIEAGTPLRAPITDLLVALEEIDAATKGGRVIDSYAFPANPPTDQRFRWIGAIHQAAKYPDLLTQIPGLAGQITIHGVNAIPEQYRTLFPVSFGLKPDFPPTVLLHGDDDVLIGFDQSTSTAEKMKSLGIDVHLERAEGQGHGFEAKSNIDLDAKDAEVDDVAMKGLRRVITALDEAVAKSAF